MPLSYHAKGTYHLRVPIERNTTEKVGEHRSDVGEHTKYCTPNRLTGVNYGKPLELSNYSHLDSFSLASVSNADCQSGNKFGYSCGSAKDSAAV